MKRLTKSISILIALILTITFFLPLNYSNMAYAENNEELVEMEESVTEQPTEAPTEAPTAVPTEVSTAVPTEAPTVAPTEAPTATPTEAPTATPIETTQASTASPSPTPSLTPLPTPTALPLYTISKLGENSAIIVKYNGNEANVIVPKSIDGLTVLEIGQYAFADNADIINLEIPEGVKKIHKFAFTNCRLLLNVKLPKTLSFIDDDAFTGCDNKNTGDEVWPTCEVDFNSYAFGFLLGKGYKYKTVEPKSNFNYAPGPTVKGGTTATKGTVYVGQAISLTIPSNNYGGTPPYEFTTYVMCNGKNVKLFPWTTSTSIIYTFTTPGTYTIKTWVRDSNKIVVNSISPAEYTVLGHTTMLGLSATINYSTIKVGEKVSFIANPTGGKTPYRFAYKVYRNNVLHQQFDYSENINIDFQAPSIGSYYAVISVKDNSGKIISATSPVVQVIGNVALSLNCTISPSSLILGNSFTVSSIANGGTPPYRYAYYVYNGSTLVHKQMYTYNSSFTYKPTSNGTYKVACFVMDATNNKVLKNSSNVNVGGTVTPLSMSNSISPSNISLGATFTANIWASGGMAPYKYAYYVYNGSTLVHKQMYTYNSSFTYKPTSNGTYKVACFVMDATNNKVLKNSSNVNVGGTATPLSMNNSISPSNISLGATFTANIWASGGMAPYKYAYYVYNGSTIVHKQMYTYNNSFTYKPTRNGTYKVACFVMDAVNNKVLKNTSNVNVGGGGVTPLSMSNSISPSNISLGATFTANIWASGGVSPYRYAYYVYNGSTVVYKQMYTYNNSFTYKPTSNGTYKVACFVMDAVNNKVLKNTSNVNVGGGASMLSVTGTLNPVSLNLGSSFTANAYASGGIPPYQYAYYVNLGSAIAYKSTYSTNSNFFYTPGTVGVYSVTCFVKDSTGTIKTAITNTSSVTGAVNPTYKALVIGNSNYPTSGVNRPGSASDINKMYSFLSTKAPYGSMSVSKRSNLSASQIVSAIDSDYGTTNANSVSIFYYSGRVQNNTCYLLGTNEEAISPSLLANRLNALNGQVIVIIDASSSGEYINKSTSETEEAKNLASKLISAFKSADTTSKSGEFLNNKFHVIAATSAGQNAFSDASGSYMTAGIVASSDLNSNGFISMYEAYIAGKNKVTASVGGLQNVQCYPSSDQLALAKN